MAIASPCWGGAAEDQYAVAAAHYGSSRWQLAVEEFEQFLSRFPQHPNATAAIFFVGESLVQLGRYDEAYGRFAESIRRDPDHRYARQAAFRLGETAYLVQRNEDARRQLEQFRRAHPDDPLNAFALAYLGDIELSAGACDRAQATYIEYLQQYPEGPLALECRFGLARAMQLQGDLAGARQHYAALGESDDARLADDALLQLGTLEYQQKDYREAARWLERLVSVFPQSELRTHAAYWLGMSQLALGDYQQAADTLAQALEEAPDHELAPAIEFSAGQSLRRLGQVDAARDRFAHVLDAWPDSGWGDDSLQSLMEMAWEQSRLEHAAELAAQFAERFPDSPLQPVVTQLLGRTLLKQSRYTEAAALFQELLDQDAGGDTTHAPDSASTGRDQLNLYYLALARLGNKDYQAALDSLGQLVPDESSRELADGADVARATALVGLQRYADALGPLESYLRSQPDGLDAAQCRAQRVLCLAKVDRLDQAAAACDELLARHAGHDVVLPTTLFLAETGYAAGNREIAQRLFAVLAQEGNPAEYVEKGLSGLAWCNFRSDRAAESVATFERLLADHPESPLAPEAALALARAQQRLQKPDAALAVYHLLIDRYANSRQLPDALLGAAQLHEKLEQKQEAERLLHRLVDEHPSYSRIDAALYQLAWLLVDLERHEQADQVFLRLATDHRGSHYWGDATYRLAERAAKAREFEGATRWLGELVAAAAEPKIRRHALYLQGQVAAGDGRWEDVEAPMQQLLEEFPADDLQLPASYWIAEANYRLNQLERAEERFARLYQETRSREDSWMGIIPLRLAQIVAQKEDWQQSYQLASSVAQQYPKFREQYEVDYLLGRCLASQARFDEAREAYERVVRSPEGGRTETAAMAQWMIGESYFHQRRFEDAIRAYYRVDSLFGFPRWRAAARLQAGKCHEQIGEWNEAVKCYAQVIKDDPAGPFGNEADQRLPEARRRATANGS